MSKAIPNLQLFLLLIFISLLSLSLDKLGLLDVAKRSLLYLTNPISFGIYKSYQDITNQFYFIFTVRFAAQENKALKEQLGQLISENATLRKRLTETESLVEQQNFLDPATYNLMAARPIGQERYLKIDKGSDHGIKAGQAVVFKDNYIGKIINISPQSANVQLLYDPDSKVAAFSVGLERRSRGIVIGQFATDIVMDKILHEEKVEVGDLVYSEGTEGFLPRGLVLGRVTQVLEQPNEVFKQAKVKPIFEIRDLEVVFVIKS